MIRKPIFFLNEVCYSCGSVYTAWYQRLAENVAKIFIEFSIKAPICLLPLMQLVPILH